MAKTIIATPNAPAAIGTYSQAVRVGDTVYLLGQIGLDFLPASMQLVDRIARTNRSRFRQSEGRRRSRWRFRWPMWSSSMSS